MQFFSPVRTSHRLYEFQFFLFDLFVLSGTLDFQCLVIVIFLFIVLYCIYIYVSIYLYKWLLPCAAEIQMLY